MLLLLLYRELPVVHLLLLCDVLRLSLHDRVVPSDAAIGFGLVERASIACAQTGRAQTQADKETERGRDEQHNNVSEGERSALLSTLLLLCSSCTVCFRAALD